tara:strand:- start:1767 stop:2444 length:678 start_codon:yes stop_codon:yes gene_type:complete
MIKDIIKEKNTRLCFSADFTTQNELFKWIDLVGPHICILKTHVDILDDFDSNFIEKILEKKEKYNFLILEDRKFADIGKTFEKQLFGGIYKIGLWADIITIHGICADGMLSILSNQTKYKSPKTLIVAQMSSIGNIIDSKYSYNCYDIAKKYSNIVIGFISQHNLFNDNNFLILTPGININAKNEQDQQYRTPQEVLKSDSDIIIVGSAIYNGENENEILNYKLF